MRVCQILTQFKELSKQLVKSLKQNKYDKAKDIALKQQALIHKISRTSLSKPSLTQENQWEEALKDYQDIRISLELDLKHLNSRTKKTLAGLSGYAKR